MQMNVTDIVDKSPTSVVFDHCKRVYGEMKAQARDETLSSESGDEQTTLSVYEGHLTKVFAQLSLSTPYYTAVMRYLKSMGCVEQLQRGGGNSPSRWALLREPTESSFLSVEGQNRSRSGRTAALEQQTRDLTRQVITLHARVSTLAAHLDALYKTVQHFTSQNQNLTETSLRGEAA